MGIPESQLITWTNRGSITNSGNTHRQIRNVLYDHTWPEGMIYTHYLQGSYANKTNVRGDSDVDIVIETTSLIHFSDLTDEEMATLEIDPQIYSLDDFREQVIEALVGYFGDDNVDATGDNSIKVIPFDTSNNLYADVVVCAEYRQYSDSLELEGQGITFWNQDTGEQIINYPKLHIQNGHAKNRAAGKFYKKAVRMFKNARRNIVNRSEGLEGLYPSYFIECLVYNLPDHYIIGGTWNDCFEAALKHWYNLAVNDGLKNLMTQSEMHYLIGDETIQWPEDNALGFINDIIHLWNTWYDL